MATPASPTSYACKEGTAAKTQTYTPIVTLNVASVAAAVTLYLCQNPNLAGPNNVPPCKVTTNAKNDILYEQVTVLTADHIQSTLEYIGTDQTFGHVIVQFLIAVATIHCIAPLIEATTATCDDPYVNTFLQDINTDKLADLIQNITPTPCVTIAVGDSVVATLKRTLKHDQEHTIKWEAVETYSKLPVAMLLFLHYVMGAAAEKVLGKNEKDTAGFARLVAVLKKPAAAAGQGDAVDPAAGQGDAADPADPAAGQGNAAAGQGDAANPAKVDTSVPGSLQNTLLGHLQELQNIIHPPSNPN
jgi:hypothetical protein